MKFWHRCYVIALAFTIIGWGVYAFAKHRIAVAIASQCGATLMKIGQGKFRDPTLFVQYRMREALWLATLALALIAAQWLVSRFSRMQIKQQRWIVQGILGFVLLNLWIDAAMNTALFWGLMGIGSGVQNLMQFHFKRILAAENSVPNRAVLVGSSQARAEIDEDLLNQSLGNDLWTTELHFPGSHAYDVLLIERQLRGINPQIVIWYLSEGSLYNGSYSEAQPNFFSFADLPDSLHRGAQHYLAAKEILAGLFGDLLPIFRCREVLAQRLFGSTTVQFKQQQYDIALQKDLDARAQETAAGFHVNAESDFQKQALEDFVARCQQANRRVVLLAGRYNPVLESRIEPLHNDMVNFLNQLKSRYSVVSVISEPELPDQAAADYEDLSHVNREAQRRFTTAVARILGQFLPHANNQ